MLVIPLFSSILGMGSRSRGPVVDGHRHIHWEIDAPNLVVVPLDLVYTSSHHIARNQKTKQCLGSSYYTFDSRRMNHPGHSTKVAG
jgi:hypothetical protein